MRLLARVWHAFWFGPQSATNLAVCRMIFFGGLLYQRWNINSSRWAELGDAFWFPISAFKTFHLPLFGASVLNVMDCVWLTALAFACIGLWSRISMGVVAVLGFYLIGLPHNFGKTHHSDAIVIFLLVGMALSRAGDKWSVDAWLARRRGTPPPPTMSGEYRWPVRVAWVAWVLLYFAAGISKLRNAGLEWAFSDSFRNVLLEHHYTHHPVVDWGLALAELPMLCAVLAAGTLVMETLAPLALVHPYARAVFAPALGMMQLGIWLVLGVKFAPFLLVFAFWIPWEEAAQFLTRGWRRIRPVRDSTSATTVGPPS